MSVLLCDADNTLWRTDDVFRRAHRWLYAEIARARHSLTVEPDPVQFVRKHDQEIARSHDLHLKYPSILLVERIAKDLKGGSLTKPELEYSRQVRVAAGRYTAFEVGS